MSTEFDALMAQTQLEREKADGIRSLVAASKLAAGYQHRAEVAEAALARVSAQVRPLGILYAALPGLYASRCRLILDEIQAALEPKP